MEASLSSGIVNITHVHNGVTIHYSSSASARVLLESKFFDFDGFHQFQQMIGNLHKTLTGVLVECGDGDLSGLDLYVGIKQRHADTAVWYGPYSIEAGDDMIHTLDVEDARLFAFRLIDESPVELWQITALELYGLVGEGRV